MAAAFGLAGQAEASVKVKTNTTSYRISGKSGSALLDAMDRKGPKHGFLTRAIAQTGYTVTWEIDWRERNGSCLIANASAVLAITYNYPEVSNALSADLKPRWQRFMAGVRKHEETHGRLAREMVAAAEKRLTHLSMKNDRGCRKTQAEMKRRLAAVYDKYEARQLAFDEVEHSEGGNVERLVNRLSGNPLLGRR